MIVAPLKWNENRWTADQERRKVKRKIYDHSTNKLIIIFYDVKFNVMKI